MIFTETFIAGAYMIERTPFKDERGYFARCYCEKEFQNAGIHVEFKQMNICENLQKGTLRGLHFQTGECAEDKVVSCLRGTVFDVCVDIRPESPTYCKYLACELSEDNGKMLYIPKGCAHGYVTLTDDCQLFYMMSEFYAPDFSAGYRYDDPAFAIDWPVKDGLILSEKDCKLPFINKLEG